jgi:Uma2 family endonuclease
MSAQPSRKPMSILAAIEHLPEGGTLILPEVGWEEYERLLEELGESNRVRVSYNQGRLEIMTLSPIHEMYKDLILMIVRITADLTASELETRGSTTFKETSFAQGAEPDTCFYVQNASQVIGLRKIDLSVAPPPDVVVEIDIGHESPRKPEIYRNLGVPEVWRYDEERLQMLTLTAEGYVETPVSQAFPSLTAEALTRFLEQSKTAGQSATLRAFRQWLHGQLPAEY